MPISPTVRKREPFKGFNFRVFFTGRNRVFESGFNYVSPVIYNMETEEQKEGGKNDGVHYIPTNPRYEPVELLRGITDDPVLLEALASQYDAHRGGIVGDWSGSALFEVLIWIMDKSGKNVKKSITLYDCIIKTYEQSELDALESSAMIDKLVIQPQGIDMMTAETDNS